MSTKVIDIRDRRALDVAIRLHDTLAAQCMRQAEKHLQLSQRFEQHRAQLSASRRRQRS